MKKITVSLVLSLALLSSMPTQGMKFGLPDSTTGTIATLGIMGIGAYVAYRLQHQSKLTATLRGAISQKQTSEVQKLVGLSGIYINAQDANGYTLLREAVEHNQAYFIKLLLEHKANPNIADKWNETPLMRAAGYGHEDCVRNLLQAPTINRQLKDAKGKTAADIARRYKHDHIADAIEGKTIVQ